ncbi:MAG: argininosuccinate synthase [Bacteroidota bacterium]
MSIVLAFSGGLDTSFCVPYLKETYQEPVYTVTVNTGGLDADEARRLSAWSAELGAEGHETVDARAELYDRLLGYLVKGNVRRGGVYPLCVGPERVVQAETVIQAARRLGARAIAHGSTGAGNDQVRFDGAIRLLAPDLELITPIRQLGLSREQSASYLRERGFDVSAEKATYSINKGLWGTTIGGAETLTTEQPLPDAAYPDSVSPAHAPDEGLTLTIGFENGVPASLDGVAMTPVALVERLNELGSQHGVGRGIHVGDTILGIKGRVGFEAPAAVTLIEAHRELEKIVLTRWQQFQKRQLADLYGMLMHEGQYFDPVMRDMEAYLDQSQTRVTGTVTVRYLKGHINIDGCSSLHSMFDLDVASYGETNQLWDARDAQGFTRIYGVQAMLAHQSESP